MLAAACLKGDAGVMRTATHAFGDADCCSCKTLCSGTADGMPPCLMQERDDLHESFHVESGC